MDAFDGFVRELWKGTRNKAYNEHTFPLYPIAHFIRTAFQSDRIKRASMKKKKKHIHTYTARTETLLFTFYRRKGSMREPLFFKLYIFFFVCRWCCCLPCSIVCYSAIFFPSLPLFQSHSLLCYTCSPCSCSLCALLCYCLLCVCVCMYTFCFKNVKCAFCFPSSYSLQFFKCSNEQMESKWF